MSENLIADAPCGRRTNLLREEGLGSHSAEPFPGHPLPAFLLTPLAEAGKCQLQVDVSYLNIYLKGTHEELPIKCKRLGFGLVCRG